VQNCASRHRCHFESASTELDGLILRLLRHPEAVDPNVHLRFCIAILQDVLDPSSMEDSAKHRLMEDGKFAELFAQLPLVKHGSEEEIAAGRGLRARARILADAHRLGLRANVTWQDAQVALEKLKCYRQLLGQHLGASGSGDSGEAELQACLDAIAKAWPDCDTVKLPKTRQKQEAAGHRTKRQRR